jgi:type I restriction enzyme R subunit
MIVTFRKPWTMRKNVEDAFRLVSQEEREWEKLIPREYKAVRKDFKDAHKAFVKAHKELEADPNDPIKMMGAIKAFQTMQNLGEAVKSYDEYYDEYNEEMENTSAELTAINEIIAVNTGHIENIKAKLRELLPETPPAEAFEIDFSPDQRATLEEKIDSYYIRQLLNDFNNESSRQKFYDAIKNRPPIVKTAYDEALLEAAAGSNVAENEVTYRVDSYFRHTIDEIIKEAANTLEVPEEDLRISFNEYNRDKTEVPYINVINNKSTLTKEEFEHVFPGEMFRRRSVVREEYWRKKIAMLLPLKEELVNFGDTLKEFEKQGWR